MPLAAARSAIARVAAQAAAPGMSPGTSPATAPEPSPEDKAAEGASLGFVFGCLVTLSAYDTAADYAAAAESTGAGMAEALGPQSAATKLDGAGGRGCRVAYTGPKADFVWRKDVEVLHKLPSAAADPKNGCSFTEDAASRLVGVCASTSDGGARTRRGDVRVERAGTTVTASVSDPRP